MTRNIEINYLNSSGYDLLYPKAIDSNTEVDAIIKEILSLSESDMLDDVLLNMVLPDNKYAVALTVKTPGGRPFNGASVSGITSYVGEALTTDENGYVLKSKGMRPLEYLEKLGWTGPDVWYAHGIHFNDEELKVLASTGTGIAHCPVSNMKLGSGVCRVPDMLQLGIDVALGVDGSASNDGSDLMAEMRSCYLLHRLVSSYDAPSGYDVLKMATVGGAKVLGRKDIGHLKEGMRADLFAVRTDCIELAGATFGPESMLATVGLSRPVDLTIIYGRVVAEDGHLVLADEDEIYRNARSGFFLIRSSFHHS